MIRRDVALLGDVLSAADPQRAVVDDGPVVEGELPPTYRARYRHFHSVSGPAIIAAVADQFDIPQVQEDFDAMLAETRSHEQEFIGLTELDAVKLADQLRIELRVIRDDHTALHLDLRARRMTVDLRAGVVTAASAG